MDEALEKVIGLYTDLLAATDQLSDRMGLNNERVLSKVFPPSKETRRNTQRIRTWFEESRESAEKRMAAELKQQAREAVLAKLSPEDRAVLEG